jgi:hypothetical protein
MPAWTASEMMYATVVLNASRRSHGYTEGGRGSRFLESSATRCGIYQTAPGPQAGSFFFSRLLEPSCAGSAGRGAAASIERPRRASGCASSYSHFFGPTL